jgi:predicted transcriptional regulator of viral defense system
MGAPIARIDHRRGTYEARMLVIFAEADRPLNATDVVVALGEGASEDVVRAFFSKLLRKGLIARVAHGLYCKRGLSAKAGTS